MHSPSEALTLLNPLIPSCFVQELRIELDKERNERAAAAARGDILQQQAERLSEEKRGLEQVMDELSSENEQLRQRAEALADSAEALLSEKYATQKKVRTPDSSLCSESCHLSCHC